MPLLVLLKNSAKDFRRPYALCACALLTAICVVVQSFTVVTLIVQLSFVFIPIAVTAVLFGPFASMLTAASSDVISFIIRPRGSFFPGLTVIAAIMGLIYGFYLYNRRFNKGMILRTIFSELTVQIICELFLKTICLHYMYGMPVLGILSTRLLKFAIAFPLNTFALIFVFKLIDVPVLNKIKAKLNK